MAVVYVRVVREASGATTSIGLSQVSVKLHGRGRECLTFLYLDHHDFLPFPTVAVGAIVRARS